jgi:hypothetical protein
VDEGPHGIWLRAWDDPEEIFARTDLKTLVLGGPRKLQRSLLERLASWPGLASVERLELHGAEDDEHEAIAIFGESPHAARIREIGVRYFVLTPETTRRVCALPALETFRSVDPFASSSPMAEGIAASEKLLRRIDLPACGVEGAKALARSPVIGSLESLRLVGNAWGELSSEGGLALAATPHTPRLRELVLDYARLDAVATAAIARTFLTTGIERFSVEFDELGVEAANAIARSSGARTLRELDLGSSRLGFDGTRALAEAPFDALEKLVLRSCAVLGGLAALLHARRMPALRSLDLSWNGIGPKGAAILADEMPGVEFLGLAHDLLGDEGAIAIAKTPFPRLRTLDLTGNEIGDKGGRALARSPHLEKLAALYLDRNPKLGAGVRAALFERFGERVSIEDNDD